MEGKEKIYEFAEVPETADITNVDKKNIEGQHNNNYSILKALKEQDFE